MEKIIQKNLDGKKAENIVHNFLKQNLKKDWEIYSEPHLNGSRPDFVCLNPNIGILVLEVKDWNLDSYEIDINGRIRVVGSSGKFEVPNPLAQIERYKFDIFNIYCPRIGESFKSMRAITCGIIFPFEKEEKIKNFLTEVGGDHYQLGFLTHCGRETLEKNNIIKILPDVNREKSYIMNDEIADDLRSWLIEPDYSAEQKEDLELNSDQLTFINTRTESGLRRIRGAAGTGKSFVIAGRASELIKQKKDVLVMSFNITLIHYLRDICSRFFRGSATKITWKNFHQWTKDLTYDLTIEKKYKKIWGEYFNNPYYQFNKDDVLTLEIPNLLNKELNQETINYTKTYDAILVDEGQDFDQKWWLLLRKILRPNGEMMLVADTTQNIYEKSTKWTDQSMLGAGFRGSWSDLKVSYRLPPSFTPYLKKFINTFFYSEENLIPIPEKKQQELDFYPCYLKWKQTNINAVIDTCRDEMLSIIIEDKDRNRAFTDLTFITDNEKIGVKIIKELESKKIKTVHTFGLVGDQKFSQKKRKMSFWKGVAKVKATTIHSFKGWEGRFIIVHISKAKSKKDFALIYTALTRIKKHKEGSFLTVICSEKNLADYGKSWSKSIS